MTIQLVCLLIGTLLPYVWAGSSLPFRNRQFGNIDLNEPRVQGEQLVDRGARAWGSQMNAWEALIVFSVANAAAFAAGVDPSGSWAMAAPIWVAARVFHGIFYIAGLAPLRVLSFVVGLAMSVWIFVMALSAA
jgi:uncharacterized MAPEG superfamily protein